MNKTGLRFVLLIGMILIVSMPLRPCKAQTGQADPIEQKGPSESKEPAVVEELTSEAQLAVERLRQQLPGDSEAIAMLESILSGRRLGAEDGWFPMSKSSTSLGWSFAMDRFDDNDDQVIDAKEFTGQAADFSRLDRTGDGKLTEADFDYSQHSLTRTPGFMLFFMADRDTNGKVTKEEFAELFDKLGGGGEFLALDDLRDQFAPPPPSTSSNSPDKPSRSTLVLGLKQQEVGSLQPGPSVGEVAPDFTLRTIKGDTVTLSEQIGEKPVVLIFGNFTCGPFRSQAGNLQKLYERYQERANIFLVYVREAHPKDGWWMQSNQRAGVDVAQPTTDEQRVEVATTCQNLLDIEIPFLVDHVNDEVGSKYSGMPNRLYLIDEDGKIVFKNGRGPFGFHPRQLEQELILLLSSKESNR